MPRLEKLFQVVLWKAFGFEFCFFTFLLFCAYSFRVRHFHGISNPGSRVYKNRHLLTLRGSPLFTTANHDPKGAEGRKNAKNTVLQSPTPTPPHNPNSPTRKIKMRFPKLPQFLGHLCWIEREQSESKRQLELKLTPVKKLLVWDANHQNKLWLRTSEQSPQSESSLGPDSTLQSAS